MMTHKEFVDVHVDDLRDNKIPKFLAENPGAVAFMRKFGDWCGVIVETAAVLGEEPAAYAKHRIADLVIEFGKAPTVRAVNSPPP